MNRKRMRGSEVPILIDLGAGATSAGGAHTEPQAPMAPAPRPWPGRTGPGADGVTLRALAASALIALVGVALPAAMPLPKPVFDPGALQPYPTAPVEAWRIAPEVVNRGTGAVNFRPVVVDESSRAYSALDPWRDYPDVWRYGSTTVAAVDLNSSLSNLVAIDVRTGAVRWTVPVVAGREFRACAHELLSGAMPCVRYGSDSLRESVVEVVLIRLTDGRELANWDAPAWARTVEVLGDSLVLAGAAPNNPTALMIARHDAWSGAERWHYTGEHALWPVTTYGDAGYRPNHILGPTILAIVGDRVIGSMDGVVAIVDAGTGGVLQAVGYGGARSLADGSVVIQYPSAEVIAAGTVWANELFDAIWADAEEYPADGGRAVSLAASAGRLVPAIGFGSTRAPVVTDAREVLVGIVGRSARPWSVADAGIFWPQVVTPAGVWGGAGVTRGRGSDYELRDLVTGQRLWAQPSTDATFVQVCGTDGERLIVLENNTVSGLPELVAFDLKTGSRAWTGALALGERATVVDGRIVVFSPAGIRGLASRGA